jgi:hypothetical protein
LQKDDGKDVNGVWLQIKPEISTLQNPVLDSYLKLIDKALDDIRQTHCDRVSASVQNDTSDR